MAQSETTAVEIVEWFFKHYKDPANGVPHDGKEGGYQYVNGGPYDAREVLEPVFGDAPPEAFESALAEITDLGYEWVRVDEY